MQHYNSNRRLHRLAERLAVVAVVTILVVIGYGTFDHTRRLWSHTERVARSHGLMSTLEQIESTMKSAETGQRGFVITGQEAYLEPYQNATLAIDGLMQQLARSTAEDPALRAWVPPLQELINKKLQELASGVEIRHQSGFEAAQMLVATNIGKRTMDSIHDHIAEFRQDVENTLAEREETAATTYWSALAAGLVSTVAGLILIVGVLYLVQHNRQRAELAALVLETERDRLQATLDRARRLETENARMDQYTSRRDPCGDAIRARTSQRSIIPRRRCQRSDGPFAASPLC